jgi:hypothetical protein
MFSSPKSIRSDVLEFVETATGKYFLPADAKGDIIAIAIKNNQIFDQPIYKIAKKFITPNSICLDVGSNFGQMAIMMASCMTEGGGV